MSAAATVTDGVARIRNAANGITGSGFIVGAGAVMTCAHVVNDALGRPVLSQERPDGTVIVDLPFVGEQGLVATVAEWLPPRDGTELEADPLSDIAILTLSRAVEVQPYALADDVTLGAQLRAIGFPRGSDQGEDAALTVGLPTTFKWLAVESGRDVGAFIRSGYSGGPAVDAGSRLVGGMIVAVGAEALRKAFLIPTHLLKQAFPQATTAKAAETFGWPLAPAQLIALLKVLSPAPLPPALVSVDLIRITARTCTSAAEAEIAIQQANQWLAAAGPVSGIVLELPLASLPELGRVSPLAFWMAAFTAAAQRGGPVLVALLAAIPEGVSVQFQDDIKTVFDQARNGVRRH